MGNNLAIIRKNRNMTQEELADKLSVTRQYISEVERNKKIPSLFMALRLSSILDADLDEIFYLK